MHPRNFALVALAMGSIAALGQRPATAQDQPFPASFHTLRIATTGTTFYTPIGGTKHKRGRRSRVRHCAPVGRSFNIQQPRLLSLSLCTEK